MMSEMGYDTVAKICLTHTFPIKDITTYVGKFDVSITELEFVQNKITKYEYNDYDRLIQLCDSMVMSKGPVTLEERMKDIIMRYGSVYPVEKRQIISVSYTHLCKEYDESGEWPKEIYDKAIELGYQMLEVPEEYGGLGLPGETILAMYEEMAWADAGFAVTMAASNLALKPILIAGSEEQKQKYCDVVINGGLGAFGLTEPNAGSDPVSYTHLGLQ